MDSTNYTSFKIGFKLKNPSTGDCLSYKMQPPSDSRFIKLTPAPCSGIPSDPKRSLQKPLVSMFEKVTFGDNSYALLDDKYQYCVTDNGMVDFKQGGCKIYSYKEKPNVMGYLPNETTYNSTIYNGVISNTMLEGSRPENPKTQTLEYSNKYIPDQVTSNDSVFASIPTLAAGYKLPAIGGINVYQTN